VHRASITYAHRYYIYHHWYKHTKHHYQIHHHNTSGDPLAVQARKGAAHAKEQARLTAPERAARAGGPAGRKHASTRRKRNEDGFPE
jgi:hypothetical protein